MLVTLRGVGAHLEPQEPIGPTDTAVAQDDVLRADALAAEDQHARPVDEIAVLDEDALVSRVVRVSVCMRTLAALDGDKVVAGLKAGRPYMDIAAAVKIDGVGTRGPHRLHRRRDAHVENVDVRASVYMKVPKPRIEEFRPGDGHTVRIADVDQPRALNFKIGAGGILLAAGPEGAPERLSIAVDDAFSGDGKAVHTIGVDKCCRIRLKDSLDMDLDFGIISNILAANDYGGMTEIQLSAWLEENCAYAVPAGGDDYRPSACRRSGVDGPLERLSLEIDHTGNSAVVENRKALAVPQGRLLGSLEEPLVDWSPVGPGLPALAGDGEGRQAKECQESKEEVPFHFFFFFCCFFCSFSA